ncbi:hypothetical protein C1646_729485 [Rhizophagus diaphanus]|nr:hypothetical protein C1646_729485 [Rhizophagus diaphanus] [Rhizophagus sp. MUCL 43196]
MFEIQILNHLRNAHTKTFGHVRSFALFSISLLGRINFKTWFFLNVCRVTPNYLKYVAQSSLFILCFISIYYTRTFRENQKSEKK